MLCICDRPHVTETALWPLQEPRVISCTSLTFAYTFVGGDRFWAKMKVHSTYYGKARRVLSLFVLSTLICPSELLWQIPIMVTWHCQIIGRKIIISILRPRLQVKCYSRFLSWQHSHDSLVISKEQSSNFHRLSPGRFPLISILFAFII